MRARFATTQERAPRLHQHRHHRDGLCEALERVSRLIGFQNKYGAAALHQQRSRRHWLREAELHFVALQQQHSDDAVRWMAQELAPDAQTAEVFSRFLSNGLDY